MPRFWDLLVRAIYISSYFQDESLLWSWQKYNMPATSGKIHHCSKFSYIGDNGFGSLEAHYKFLWKSFKTVFQLRCPSFPLNQDHTQDFSSCGKGQRGPVILYGQHLADYYKCYFKSVEDGGSRFNDGLVVHIFIPHMMFICVPTVIHVKSGFILTLHMYNLFNTLLVSGPKC